MKLLDVFAILLLCSTTCYSELLSVRVLDYFRVNCSNNLILLNNTVTNTSDVKVEWTRQNQTISTQIVTSTNEVLTTDNFNTSTIYYEIASVQMDDAGEYQCLLYVAFNDTFVLQDNFIHSLVVQDVPSTPGVPVLSSINSSAVNITYESAVQNVLNNSSPIIGYNIKIISADGTSEMLEAPPDRLWIVADSLHPYTQYEAQLRVVNAIGESELGALSNYTYTQQAAPLQAPFISLSHAGATFVTLRVVAPPNDTHNGVLDMYEFNYTKTDNCVGMLTVKLMKSNPVNLIEHNVTDLCPYNTYHISVVVTNDGGKHRSPPATITVNTTEDAPSPPIITNTLPETRNVTITWLPPVRPNGPIKYYIITWWIEGSLDDPVGSEQIQPVPDKQPIYTINGLAPFTSYAITLVAVNSHYTSTPSRRTFHTDIEAPNVPRGVAVDNFNATTITISWHKPFKSESLNVYDIRIIRRDTMLMSETRYSGVSHGDNQSTSVIISDLQAGATYEFQVAGVVQSIVNPTETYKGNYSAPVIITLIDPSIRPSGGSTLTTGVIAGIACTFLLLILVIILLVIMKCFLSQRYSFIPDQDTGNVTGTGILVLPEAYTAPRPAKTPDDSECISVNDWLSHVNELHADGDLGFSQQYDDINKNSNSLDLTAHHSHDAENKNKNRYINILSYDHSRVILRPLPGKNKQSDYINANYVDGYHKPKAYIATQGPLPSTFPDFWRMVWEQNSNVICMITNLTERGRRKCDQYWPTEGEHTYGAIHVRLLSTYEMAHYTVRVLTLKNIKLKKDTRWSLKGKRYGSQKAAGPGERIVKQYHYTYWPDHGVPDYTLPVLHYVRKSVCAAGEDSGPIIIHCSAGVGRTGTYIVLDSMMRQILDKTTVNVQGFLNHIRGSRNYLVQTEDQYIFIHDALLEFIQSGGDTEVKSVNFKQHLDDLEGGDHGVAEEEEEEILEERGPTKLQLQYQLVTSFHPKESDTIAALLPVNEKKNRSTEVLPLDISRVCLPMVPGEEGSDYVNASYLQGYNRNEEFIVTQHPLEETIEDFWRMVYDKNSMTIVLLSSISEDCVSFWPTSSAEEMDCGNFKVSLIDDSEIELDNHSSKDFLLQSTQDDYECTTRLICAPDWPHVCEALTSTFDLVKVVKAWHQANQIEEGPIIVIDKLGTTECGLFCALSTLYDQLHNESCVDVYVMAKLYHLKRPAIFLTQETYLYLFKAIASICDETADRDSGIGNCKNYPSLITTTKPTNGTLNNGTIKPDAASV